eukprot:m.203918 g.203918  ORF g.203918 m.203918 type:complete len:368 (-) comp25295_c0_seq1:14-1117(-)
MSTCDLRISPFWERVGASHLNADMPGVGHETGSINSQLDHRGDAGGPFNGVVDSRSELAQLWDVDLNPDLFVDVDFNFDADALMATPKSPTFGNTDSIAGSPEVSLPDSAGLPGLDHFRMQADSPCTAGQTLAQQPLAPLKLPPFVPIPGPTASHPGPSMTNHAVEIQETFLRINKIDGEIFRRSSQIATLQHEKGFLLAALGGLATQNFTACPAIDNFITRDTTVGKLADDEYERPKRPPNAFILWSCEERRLRAEVYAGTPANTASPTLRDTWANLHEGDKEKWKQKSRILFREFKSNHPDVSYHPPKSKCSLARKRKPSSPRSQAKGIGVRSPLRPTGSFLDQDPAGFDHHVLTHCGPSPTGSF